MRESEAMEILERLQDSQIRVEEAAEALRPAVGWDPERVDEEKPIVLPGKLFLSARILLPVDVKGDRGWFIRDDKGGIAPLAVYHHGAFTRPSDIPHRLLEAMVAAYNREREEERIEAEIDDAKLDEGLTRMCREAIDAEIQFAVDAVVARWRKITEHQVQVERARCLGVFDWLLSVIPQGWDFVRRYTEAARRKLESGEVPLPAGDWPGAEGLPPEATSTEPERCEWPGCTLPALCRSGNFQGGLVCSEHFKLTNGAAPESASFQEHLRFSTSGLVTDYDRGLGWRTLTPAEAAEAQRRWQAEPKLRLWKNVTAGLLETERKVRERLREERDGLLGRIDRADGVLRQAWSIGGDFEKNIAIDRALRILTEKES